MKSVMKKVFGLLRVGIRHRVDLLDQVRRFLAVLLDRLVVAECGVDSQGEEGSHRRLFAKCLQRLAEGVVAAVVAGEPLLQGLGFGIAGIAGALAAGRRRLAGQVLPGQAPLGIERELMRLQDLAVANGVDPETSKLLGLPANEPAVDLVRSGRGDEENGAQHQRHKRSRATGQVRRAGRDSPQGKRRKGYGRQRYEPQHRRQHCQGREQAGQQAGQRQRANRAVACDFLVGGVEDARRTIGCGHG